MKRLPLFLDIIGSLYMLASLFAVGYDLLIVGLLACIWADVIRKQ